MNSATMSSEKRKSNTEKEDMGDQNLIYAKYALHHALLRDSGLIITVS